MLLTNLQKIVIISERCEFQGYNETVAAGAKDIWLTNNKSRNQEIKEYFAKREHTTNINITKE